MSKSLPLEWLNGPIVDSRGRPLKAFSDYLRKAVEAPLAPIAIRSPEAGTVGQIQNTAVVSGRSEGIGTTVSQLNSAGQLLSTDQIAADGSGNPLSGGKRGFQALNANNQLANSFINTGVNVSSTPNSSTTLSNDGTHTAVSIAASSNQFAPATVSYNSGTVDPGGSLPFTLYVYAADSQFQGGAVPYSFSTTPQQQTAKEGNVLFGKITTASGSSKTGGGATGGTTGGGAGGRGFIQ